MAQAIAVEKVEKYTNYSGLDDGAEPVLVYRKAKFVVVNVGEPKADSFFGGSEFREVKFVEVGTANVFKNSLFEGHYPRLTSIIHLSKLLGNYNPSHWSYIGLSR